MSTSPELVMIGSGDHARVLQEVLSEAGFSLLGYIAPNDQGSMLADDVAWLGDDAALMGFDTESHLLVNGVGSVGPIVLRETVYSKFKTAGFNFLQLEAQTAHVSASAALDEGVQIMHNAVVHVDASVFENAIVNTGAIVEHHCRIGRSSHISIGAVLGGHVVVGDQTHVGANATIKQGVKIGSNCVIGAGAVVLQDVPDNHVAVGVPAVNKPAKGGHA